jgi:hypothetical protein
LADNGISTIFVFGKLDVSGSARTAGLLMAGSGIFSAADFPLLLLGFVGTNSYTDTSHFYLKLGNFMSTGGVILSNANTGLYDASFANITQPTTYSMYIHKASATAIEAKVFIGANKVYDSTSTGSNSDFELGDDMLNFSLYAGSCIYTNIGAVGTARVRDYGMFIVAY